MSKYTDAVDSNLNGLTAVSSGVCPGCEECADEHSVDLEELQLGWESGKIFSEPSFSARGCGVCGSNLAGDLETWHAIDDNTGTLYHFKDMCVDCVVYIANGDEPEATHCWSCGMGNDDPRHFYDACNPAGPRPVDCPEPWEGTP